MIYLKNKQGGNILAFKDHDKISNLLDSGQWIRIKSRKDESEYVEVKSAKKKEKSKNVK